MKENRFKKRVLSVAAYYAKEKNSRAFSLFSKLRRYADTHEKNAFLDFHEAKCEMDRGNYEKAISMFRSSADLFCSIKQDNMACTSYLMLGNALDLLKKYDDASDAYIEAEALTSDPVLLCEIKTLCAESKMNSDTVYDTELFTAPCRFIQGLIDDGKDINVDYFIRSCLIAAQASFAINNFVECAEFCIIGMEFADADEKRHSSPYAFDCAVLLSKSAVQTFNYSIIKDTAHKAYLFIHPSFRGTDNSDWITLLYTLTLIRNNDLEKAKQTLSDIDISNASPLNILFFDYCYGRCYNEKYELDDNAISMIPLNNIDELFAFAESIVDYGFPELSAEIYRHSLSLYNNCRSLILRPLASLLYRLELYGESASCYSELVKEEPDSILCRAYALASHRSGDTKTAEQQLLSYIDISSDKETSLTLAAMLSMEESFSPQFSASLYSRLSALLEQEKPASQEIVDAYNRLGICLYRSEAPLEAEMNAFKKAASHAEACEAVRNTNIHAVIICNLAECYMRDGKTDLCYDTFKIADSIFSTLDDLDLIQYSTCLKFMSDILLLRGDKDGAVEVLQKSIDLLEPHSGDSTSVAHQLSLCRNALGTVYFKLGKPELEIPELTKAIDLAHKNSVDASSLALLYSNRGEAYERLGKYDRMAEDYAVFLSLSDNDKLDKEDQISRAAKWLSIGRYREDSMQHTNAISAYNTALKLLNSLSLPDDHDVNELTAFAYYQLGNAYCHHNIKDFNASLDSYSHSIKILETLPSGLSTNIHLASTYEARAAFYEVFGEHALASSDLKRAEALRSDAFSEIQSI